MKLNHLHLTVSDVRAASAFLQTYFGLRGGGEGQKNFEVVLDDDGFVLTLMKAAHRETVAYPGHFHIGFGQPDEAAVDALNTRLRGDGYDVAPPERFHAYTFYMEAPGGFTVEVFC